VKLTVSERIVLLGVLPREGNFLTLKIVRQLRESLSFNEEELKKLSIVQQGDRITWNAESESPEGEEIAIGEKVTDLIVETLKSLDKSNKLTDQHFSIYEKFI
jgi:hypothetical protein